MSYSNQDNDFSEIQFCRSPNTSEIAKKNPLSVIKKNISNNLKKPQVTSKMTESSYIQEQDAQLLSQIKMEESLVFQNRVDQKKIKMLNPNSDILQSNREEQQQQQNNMEQSLQFASDVPTQKINLLNPINSSVKKFSNVQQQQKIPQPQINDKKGSVIKGFNKKKTMQQSVQFQFQNAKGMNSSLIKKMNPIVQSQINRQGQNKNMYSSDLNFETQLSNSVIKELNPIQKKTKSDGTEHMTTSKSTISGPQTQNPKVYNKKQFTKIEVMRTNEQLQDYFADYELNLEAAILLNYLSQQASRGIFDKKEEKQIKFFQYIVKLQGLYLIFNKQQHRMNSNIYTKQKQQLISKGKQLLYSIYQQLKVNNKQINSEFKNLYNFSSFKILIQKKLEHPNKIYTIFTTQEIQKVYFDVLAIVYKKVYSILKEKHTELHLRLSLLILISMKFKQIFNREELEQSFRIFYTERKVIRRDRIETNQLIEYIIESNSRVILKHHKELRKKFQIYQQ